MSMKKSNDTIGNRTCDLPACSAVPQPTAPPRAPQNIIYNIYKYIIYRPKFVILYTYHSDIYLRELGNEDPWLFFEAKRDPRAKQFRKH